MFRFLRIYLLRNEGKRFTKGDWMASIQWIDAANASLGKNMAALDPDYFQAAMDDLGETLKKAYKEMIGS